MKVIDQHIQSVVGRSLIQAVVFVMAHIFTWTSGLWTAHSQESTAGIRIRSVQVDGEPMPIRQDEKLRLSSQARSIGFEFGLDESHDETPSRIRFKLDGYEDAWRELAGSMRVNVRFLDDVGDQVSETIFRIAGESKGWTGDPATASFTPRREEIEVPPGATKYWVVMTSAGPPATVGIYAITNLVVNRRSATNPEPVVSLPWAFDDSDVDGFPRGWIRDGLRPSMAGIFRGGSGDGGFVIVDDDLNGHAEWAIRKDDARPVRPGDVLEVEWAEAYSFGLVKEELVSYADLHPGYYRFRINQVSVSGIPGTVESSIAFEVPATFWRTPWFWVSVLTMSIATGLVAWRASSARRLQHELRFLEQQRAVDRERLRIAQDIHDDLGARVTQISLLSAVAESKSSLPDEARAEFGKVSRMTRDLVSALHETVWAVNPENDNLDALANFLCQMSSQLSSQARLRCRLEVPEIPSDIMASSQMRHHLIMAVKEAVNNVIKHADATEMRIRISLENWMLRISVLDDGRGFDSSVVEAGNGLNNLESRMNKIGGSVSVESRLGVGTEIRLDVPVSLSA